ncbi:MAG: hypothetical protein QM737_00055 [Ferruginibacter sp.]
MMRYLLIILICLNCQGVVAQDDMLYRSKLQLNTAFGWNIPLTKLLSGAVTDNLFKYEDNTYYWQVVSVTYFFKKHWGVEFNLHAGSSEEIFRKAKNYQNLVAAQYGNNYYGKATPGSYENGDASADMLNGEVSRKYLGMIYRYETKRFFLYPKVSLGITSFTTNWGASYLKEKNTNQVYKVEYNSGRRGNDHFTVALSAKTGYKISKRFYIDVDVLGSWFKTNINFAKTTTNMITNEKIIEPQLYKKDIYTLSMGAGLIYSLINKGSRHRHRHKK